MVEPQGPDPLERIFLLGDLFYDIRKRRCNFHDATGIAATKFRSAVFTQAQRGFQEIMRLKGPSAG